MHEIAVRRSTSARRRLAAVVGAALLCAGLMLSSGCASAPRAEGAAASPAPLPAATTVTPFSELAWTALNPARGDASPQATNLWGDRKEAGPTGFLVRFVKGFSSPPHIHNVSYRGVVIRGQLHNDDPKAEAQWMPPGSYWTQPKGANHITSANADVNVAFVEIDEGPYLVRPADQAFDTLEEPINMHAVDVVWIDGAALRSTVQPVEGVALALLWGAPLRASAGGLFVRLAPGASVIVGSTARVDAVVVSGTLAAGATGASAEPGSYVGSEGALKLSCDRDAAAPCLVYARSNGAFSL